MSTPEASCEPCPDWIINDMGGSFAMGVAGGSAFHFLKGVKNSPLGERLYGGCTEVRMHASRTGGRFAVWGGLFSVFNCSLVYLRQKEDPWNSILAGACTGGLLSVRKGAMVASRSALVGGVFLALFEGVEILLNRFISSQQEDMMVRMAEGEKKEEDVVATWGEEGRGEGGER